MKAGLWFLIAGSFMFLLLAGCNNPAPTKANEKEEMIKTNLAQLSPEDREAALAQKYCVIESENRLGSMGVPQKVMVKDQPVFVCCESCLEEAEKKPDKMLDKVKELKAASRAP